MDDSVVLAHMGGAPEVIAIALPLLIFIAFMLAARLARRKDSEYHADDQKPGGEQGGDAP